MTKAQGFKNKFLTEMIVASILFLTIFKNLFLEGQWKHIYYILTAISCVLGIYVILKIFSLHCKGQNNILLFCFSMGVAGAINICFVDQCNFKGLVSIYLIYFPVSLWLAYVETEKIKVNLNFWKIIFLIGSIFIIIKYLLSDNEMLFINKSRNCVSEYLTEIMFILVFMCEYSEKKMPIVYIFIYFWGCLIGRGRGGIITAFVFFALVFISRFIGERNTAKILMLKTIGLATFIILAWLCIYNWSYVMNTFLGGFVERKARIAGNQYFSVLKMYFSSNARVQLLKTYFRSIFKGNVITNILVGQQTIVLSPLYAEFNGNAHNSYILTHASFGVFGFIYVVWGIFLKTFRLIKKKHLELAFIIIAFTFRSAIDNMFPMDLGIVIPLYCILSCISESK